MEFLSRQPKIRLPLSDLELTERLSAENMSQLKAGLSGDRDGNAFNWEGDSENLEITPDQYSTVHDKGLPAHLEIDLPSNTDVHLVTAVYDFNSGKAGTLEIPVSAAPLPAATNKAN